MIFPKQKATLWGVLMFLVFSLSCTGSPLLAAENDRPTMRGEVAYGEPVKFDYNQDGTLKDIQLWASFELKPAVGKDGEPGYLPEEGYVRRYMKDLALGAPVIGYSQFNMLPDNPLGDEVPATDIQLSGNTATFIAGLHYTIVDGGEGLTNDSITANDGIRQYPVRLLDGDITINNLRQ